MIDGFSASYTGGYFDANGRMSDLLGPFDLYGASGIVPPFTVGADLSFGGDIALLEVSGGLSIGFPVEAHFGPTNTILVRDDAAYLDAPGLGLIWASLDLILAILGFV